MESGDFVKVVLCMRFKLRHTLFTPPSWGVAVQWYTTTYFLNPVRMTRTFLVFLHSHDMCEARNVYKKASIYLALVCRVTYKPLLPIRVQKKRQMYQHLIKSMTLSHIVSEMSNHPQLLHRQTVLCMTNIA